MSYENPQIVVDTESAKYYAQAISGIGQNVAKAIQQSGDRRRAEAKARKKQNLLDSNNRTKFGSEYLAIVNKSLLDFDMSSEISPQLNELINKAADVKTRLGNMTQGSDGYYELKDDLNALETFFSVGLQQGLENFVGIRSDFSQGQGSIGSEQVYQDDKVINFGLSASATQPQSITDILSTLPNTKPIKRSFAIERLKGEDGKMGAYNIFAAFGKKFKDFTGEEVADFRKIPERRYNINTDFGTESVVTNPNITNTVTKALNDLKITEKGELNYKNKLPSAGLASVLIEGEYETVNRGGITMQIPKISLEALRAKLNNSLVSRIGGIVKSGDAEAGDLGIGLNRMQSYVDDILPEKLDDMVGTLEPDPSTQHGLTQESYDRLETAIVMVKKRQLEGSLIGTEVDDSDDRTADEKNFERKEGNRIKEINSLGKTLANETIGSFQKIESPAFKKLADYIDNISGLTIDDSKVIMRGEQEGVRIIGPNNKILIHTGMSEAQIKKAIMIASGAKKEEIETFDFSPIDAVEPTDVLDPYRGLDLNIN